MGPHARSAMRRTLLASSALVLLLAGGCSTDGASEIRPADIPERDRPPVVVDPAPGAPVPEWQTAEYGATATAFDRIGVAEAYQARTSGTAGGAGIRVAVVDSGVDTGHADLEVAESYIFNTVPQTPDGHGTHVAGTIGARRDGNGVHGVAYNADIVAMQAARDGSGTFANIDIAYAVGSAGGRSKQYGDTPRRDANGALVPIRDAFGNPKYDIDGNPMYERRLTFPDAGSDIINLSLGGPVSDEHIKKAMSDAVDGGAIVVAATGNDGADEPGYPARYAADPGMGGMVVAVGATDPADTTDDPRAVFSNACGVAMNQCVVAPGVGITSTLPGDTYGQLDGTSMATPHVSGALAVLKGAFPGISAKGIVDRLLATTDDRGAPGTDPVYGRGEINLARAMAPVGTLSVPKTGAVAGASAAAASTTLALGAGFGEGLGGNAALANAMALDAQQFPFVVDLGQGVKRREATGGMGSLIGAGGAFLASTVPGNGVFSVAAPFDHHLGRSEAWHLSNVSGDRAVSDDMPATRLQSELGGDVSLSLAVNAGLSQDYGLGSAMSGERGLLVGEDAVASPLEGIAGRSTGARLAFQADDDTEISYGAFKGTGVYGDSDTGLQRLEVARRVGDASLVKAGFGRLDEDDVLFGGDSSGAFSADQSAASHYLNLFAQTRVAPGISLFGTYTESLSVADDSGDGLLRDWSDVHANAFGAGVMVDAVVDESDRFTFLVGQPLRVWSASATLDVPTGRDAQGNVVRQAERVDLTPDGRETLFSIGYARPLGDATDLASGVYLRLQPDHDADAAPDVGAGVRMRSKF